MLVAALEGSAERTAPRTACLLVLLASLACGEASVTTDVPQPPTDTTPDPPYYATVTASGVSPNVVHVWRGRAVIFRNDDTSPHSFYADPHPAHTECAGVLNLGSLKAGEQREISNLPINACFFHSDDDPTRQSFQGVVVVH